MKIFTFVGWLLLGIFTLELANNKKTETIGYLMGFAFLVLAPLMLLLY